MIQRRSKHIHFWNGLASINSYPLDNLNWYSSWRVARNELIDGWGGMPKAQLNTSTSMKIYNWSEWIMYAWLSRLGAYPNSLAVFNKKATLHVKTTPCESGPVFVHFCRLAHADLVFSFKVTSLALGRLNDPRGSEWEFLHAKPWIPGGDIHGCYSLVKIAFAPICACKNNRQKLRHNANASRSRDVTDQLWWRHNVESEKTVLSDNGEMSDRWLFVAKWFVQNIR